MIKTTIVGLGDSLTSGYGMIGGDNYINRLEKYLPKYYPSILWSIHNISKVGITTREGLDLLKDKILPLKPNIVMIMLGTNDISLDNAMHRTIDEFEKNTQNMLELISEFNNRTGLNNCVPIPFLITPPCIIKEDLNSDKSNNRLHQYVHITKQLGNTYSCPVIDFFSITCNTPSKALLFQEDGIHLSKAGYDLLYDTVFGEFTKLINYEGLLKDREQKRA
ncbi:lysophospholipase L1-like esterase [Natranaerovirga pectinivora]|uniref:Lysophospholipase L1-like esterase n=1 Tax=Natranaerovirga pectinivora TaxID=682400 RepID=A0A4R3MP35_9FIRM|nr:SGNH/GDSL hydrolase family protein [Natranaerovirga pectinivora]TCT15349.1 lysophospholipase L1-like esterase [Natranaerovirga pectinivora]